MANNKNNSDYFEAQYQSKLRAHQIARFVICIIITIIALFPLFVLVINATRPSNDIIKQGVSFLPGLSLFDNFKTLMDPNAANGAYASFKVLNGYINSLIIAGCSAALSVFFSGMTAYGLVVYDFKLKNFATTFIVLVMMIPTQVVSVGLLQFMVQIGLVDNYLPLIIPAIAAPQVVFFMLQYMRSSFPLEIVEAARIDGSGEFRTFIMIALPILKPAFAVQAIFAFVASWNNYYTPSMLLLSVGPEAKTMPMMVANILGNDKTVDYGVQYLAIALSILPVVVIYLLLSKFIVKGVALGAVKG